MPRAADNGDTLKAIFFCRADHLAHVGLALSLAVAIELLEWGWNCRIPQCGDGLQNRGKDVCSFATVLDHMLPPSLAVGISGGMREICQGIDGYRSRSKLAPLSFWLRI